MAAAELPMEEEDKEEDWRRGSSVASGVVPLQVPEPVEGGPVWPGLWFSGKGAWEAGQGLPASEKAWGKVPAMEPPPPETDEELVW